jgi:hypothetical protein
LLDIFMIIDQLFSNIRKWYYANNLYTPLDVINFPLLSMLESSNFILKIK